MSGLDQAFDVVEDTAEVIPEKNKLHLKKPVEGDDIIKDYEYARGNLYSLIDKGQEAVNGALDLAMSSDCLLYTSPSPRDRQKSRMPSSA